MKNKFERHIEDATVEICKFIDKFVAYLDKVHDSDINDRDFYILVAAYDCKLDAFLEAYKVDRKDLEDVFYFSTLEEYFKDTYK